jgi:hypothetical protein
MSRTIDPSGGTLTVAHVTVGTSPTFVASSGPGYQEITITNTGSQVIDLGDEYVAVGAGYPLQPAGGCIEIACMAAVPGRPRRSWYAVSPGGWAELCVARLV